MHSYWGAQGEVCILFKITSIQAQVNNRQRKQMVLSAGHTQLQEVFKTVIFFITANCTMLTNLGMERGRYWNQWWLRVLIISEESKHSQEHQRPKGGLCNACRHGWTCIFAQWNGFHALIYCSFTQSWKETEVTLASSFIFQMQKKEADLSIVTFSISHAFK